MNKKPLFLSVDGVDGSGKSTAVAYLRQILESQGHRVKIIKGMGTGLLGTVVREHLLDQYIDNRLAATACGLALIDCYKHAAELLAEGYSVISDRSIATYYAYNVKGNLDPGALAIYQYILSNEEIITVKPELSIIIDVDLTIAKERIQSRPEEITHIDERSIEYFKEVTAGYYEFFINNRDLNSKFIINNGSLEQFKQSLLSAIN